MKKSTITLTIVALLVLLIILIFMGGNRSDNVDTIRGTEDTVSREDGVQDDTPDEKEYVSGDGIRVSSPYKNATVEKGFALNGEARGPWFFEASMNGSLVDDQGNVLAQFPINADGEWMTEDFVPFSESVTWNSAYQGKATILIEAANPSGMPENAKSIEIPVVLSSQNSGTVSLQIFFSDGANGDCRADMNVVREVPATRAVATASINELIKGLTSAESQAGYVSSIPEGSVLNSIRVSEGVAYADFNSELNNIAGSCNVTLARSQIRRTLLQFPTVDDVVISVNGDTEEVLQP